MLTNMEALWAKFMKRRGSAIVKGPSQKKSRGGQVAPAPTLQALVVDLEVLKTIGVAARQGGISSLGRTFDPTGWSGRRIVVWILPRPKS